MEGGLVCLWIRRLYTGQRIPLFNLPTMPTYAGQYSRLTRHGLFRYGRFFDHGIAEGLRVYSIAASE